MCVSSLSSVGNGIRQVNLNQERRGSAAIGNGAVSRNANLDGAQRTICRSHRYPALGRETCAMVAAEEVPTPRLPINAGPLMGAGALKGAVGALIVDQHCVSAPSREVQRLTVGKV